MIENEQPNPFRWVLYTIQALSQTIHDRAESVFLDQVQQFLFGFEVVVKARERNPAGAREIAHRGRRITLVTEDTRSVKKNPSQTAIKLALQSWPTPRTPALRRNL